MTFDIANHPHRRRNPLTGAWVLVSPHRSKRPWQGELAHPVQEQVRSYDPTCYLCPRNTRANGTRNPDYAGPFAFDNDFPALLPDIPAPASYDPLFALAPARGTARVLCFSPDHARSLPQLDEREVRAVIDLWCAQSAELGRSHAHVQIFENKGAMMGCSNPHPHGQIWASDFVPTEVAAEDARQAAWCAEHGAVMLDMVARAELADGARVVESDPWWVLIVPFWASWPFETLLIAREPARRLDELSQQARAGLSVVIRRLTARYDNLFGVSFPYSMGWHGAPHDLAESAHWRLHAHWYPPLLRSASVRKFMVGFEMLAEAQRDLTPEAAAERLRAASPA